MILFNMKESNKEDERECEREDRKICEIVSKEMLEVNRARVEDVYRLGEKRGGRERSLVASLSEEYDKWQVVKRCKNLRDAEEEEIRKIKINVDKTKRERKQEANLRERLQEKRREGGRWIIRRGQIVRQEEEKNRE